jgi:serine/threonine protein kinase
MASILVVDDEPGIREFLVDALATDGHHIAAAANGVDALRHLASQPYDVMITDLQMPGPLDGAGLIRSARTAYPDTQVVVLTAHGTVATAVEAMKFGALDFLEKPVQSPAVLRSLVARATAARHANGDLAGAVARALGPEYEMQGIVGRGGHAIVFRVHDRQLNRELAIKALLPDLAASATTATRFRREAQLAARLVHPNIVPNYFVGPSAAGAPPFFAMPLIEGESLARRIQHAGRLSFAEASAIARDVAAALDFAHRAGVVHRDVKPDNILLDTRGRALLTDFGIAKALSGGGDTDLTAVGTVVGTAQYLSPEQATGEGALDARSDIYSLAVVLYEMLEGRPPFNGSSAHAIFAQHISARVPPLHASRTGAPRHVGAVLAKALAKRPGDRFASATEFIDALDPHSR